MTFLPPRSFSLPLHLAILFTLCFFCGIAHAEPKPMQEPPVKASLAPSLQAQAQIPATAHEAEVLHAINTSSVKANGHWEQQNYYSIRINTLEAARDYGRLAIQYNHYYSNTSLDFARVRSATGKINNLASDAVQVRVTGGGQDFYSDSSELVFSLPDVSPGSIIEFQYSQTSNELAFPELFTERAMPYWFQAKVGNDGWRGDYVHNYSLTLNAPSDLTLHTKAFMGFPAKAKTKKANGITTRTWSINKVAPLYPESWSEDLHKLAPMLRISTLNNWSAVDAWTWSNVKDKIQPTDELKAIVSSFNLAENATREEKIRAVYSYLQSNIRYVFAHLGRGGYEPHFANEIVANNYGDCKDQTVVGVALLRMLGVHALPALVETASAGRSDTTLVNLIFDHMIIYIPASGNYAPIWMDTTGDRSLYPGMSNYAKGQTALIVDGTGGKLTTINEGFADDYAHVKLDYHRPQKGEMQVDVRIELSGFFEQNIRNWWIHNNDRETDISNFLSSLFSNSLDFSVVGNVKNSENLWQPAYIEGTLTFKNSEDNFETLGASFGQANNLFGNYSSMQIPDTRKNAYWDVTEWKLYSTSTFRGTDNTIPTLLGASDDMTTPYFTLKQKGEVKGNDYVVTMEFTKPMHHLSVKEYQDYYAQLTKLNQIGSWMVSQQAAPADPALAELENIKSKNGEKSFSYQLALARHRIELGNFEKALEPAKKAVALNKKSGEAWHVLGMVQGFNSLIEDSMASFEKAESLGYLP
ncbi:DUF3857 domain-containing protein [Saccharophagus degradans]|uniref:DUF3857 and transglutaminase domain-containing protein n=1 Tax=Saccharophagus degradans TaxID=86304 RepID=UPI001C09EB45|nr:DUF3857 and transglutaminase domain-containing protein [Saccharophagus degradans]MBU2986439.1 DUF3857 domain-containing protein [Saccharophagus degradans]